MSDQPFIGRLDIDPTVNTRVIELPGGKGNAVVLIQPAVEGEPSETRPTRQQLLDAGWVEFGALTEDGQ